jgi:DNA-binding GntR family transcriptional regulator
MERLDGRAAARYASPYDRIKQAIVEGTFEPGQALPEAVLSEWCGVSRTPIREALGRLEHDGLVERNGRAVMVVERTPKEILDIYETRIALEGTAARMAAEHYGVLDKVRLDRLVSLEEKVDTGHPSAMANANQEFHQAIWAATQNRSLIDLLGRLQSHLLRYPLTTLTAPGRWEQALLEHREILAAIIDRDPVKAQEAAERHFTGARDVRLKLWEQGLA